MGAVEGIAVELVYALPQQQRLFALVVPEGTTIARAIELSGICQNYPQIDLQRDAVGVFGRLRRLEDVLQAGDRIEIYRPLAADPKSARRQRVVQRRKSQR